MWCVNCHQKQAILLTMLQDWRILHMACMMLPDASGASLTKHCVVMAWFPRVLIDAVMCCIPYSRVSEPGNKITHTQWHDTSIAITKPRMQTEADAAFEKQENPWQESSIFLQMIFSGQVEPKWNNVSERDSKRISKLVQKTRMIWPSQDKEFVGWKIHNQDRTLRWAHKRLLMNLRRHQ